MGVRTLTGLFEQCDLDPEERFDLIICSQTFNHLLDPRLVTEKVRGLLRPEGVFFLECIDFFNLCKLQGAFYNAVQIDHVSMFVPVTLQAMCQVVGLEVIPGSLMCDRLQSAEALEEQRASGAPFCHARLLARPGRPEEPPAAYQAVRDEIDGLHLHPIRTFLTLKLRPINNAWSALRRRAGRYVSAVNSRKC